MLSSEFFPGTMPYSLITAAETPGLGSSPLLGRTAGNRLGGSQKWLHIGGFIQFNVFSRRGPHSGGESNLCKQEALGK